MSLPDGALSIRAYAKSLGVSDTTVRKAINSKPPKIQKGFVRPEDGSDPYILPEVANKEWGQFLNPAKGGNNSHAIQAVIDNNKGTKKVKKVQNEDHSDLTDEDLESDPEIKDDASLSEGLRVQSIYKAKLLKLKYLEEEGKLVDKKDIERDLFNLGKEIRQTFEILPQQVLDDILSAANNRSEAMMILKDAINNALLKVAKSLGADD